MSMKVITFWCPAEYIRKLKHEPSKNTHWNSMSEILRELVELYFEDPQVRRAVHKAHKSKLIAQLGD